MKIVALFLAIFLSAMLTACGGGSNVKSEIPAAAPVNSAAKTDTAVKPAAPAKHGGYYLDDGPGENPPADIDSISDAAPRAEIPLPRANRPYSALGIRYTPNTEYVPYKQRGLASWYGKRYHGQKSSSGEVYDMYSMTGAHTTLPLPSYVRVTNVENGRSVIVRINDRGPFHSDRIIDLSYAAAYKLRLLEKGSGIVEVEAIDTRSAAERSSTRAAASATATAFPPPVSLPAAPITNNMPSNNPNDISNDKIASLATLVPSGEYVQVGAFKFKTNADGLRDLLLQKNLAENAPVQSWYNAGTYRVRLGPYTSLADAEHAAVSIKQALNVHPVIIHQH